MQRKRKNYEAHSHNFGEYEKLLGEKLNKKKRVINLHHSIAGSEVIMEAVEIYLLRKDFSSNYLGCPIFYKRKYKAYY